MNVNAEGHLGGDPTKFCERLTLDAGGGNWADARELALLYRVLGDPDTRARLLDMAARIDAEQDALSDVLTG